MLTDEQAQKIYDAMVEEWGDRLPNPEHHPKQAEYYIKLFKYSHSKTLEQILNK